MTGVASDRRHLQLYPVQTKSRPSPPKTVTEKETECRYTTDRICLIFSLYTVTDSTTNKCSQFQYREVTRQAKHYTSSTTVWLSTNPIQFALQVERQHRTEKLAILTELQSDL